MKSIFRLCSLLLATGAAHAAADSRPNILFIMTDDHAAHATGIYGSKVNKTPHLDALGTAGMVFENAFVTNSICTPSRATLLTGKYSHKNGTPVFNKFDGSQPTVAKIMQQAGYHTGMIGKWHLGSDPTGFDFWEILPGQGTYTDPVLYNAEGKKKYEGKYATHVITDLSMEFLDKRPKDKPFLLFCHHKAPHREWTPEPKYAAEFATKTFPEPADLFDDFAGRSSALREQKQSLGKDYTNRDLKLPQPADSKLTPMQWSRQVPEEATVDGKVLKGEEFLRWKYNRYLQDYLACLQSVDDGVGQLMSYLKANGLEENTLVLYTSDNGFFLGDKGLYDKRFMYEESLRIPLLARWPAKISQAQRTNAIALNVDFAPTFLAAAGLPVPADMQGKSLLPVFSDVKPKTWRQSMYYRYYHDPGDHNTRSHLGVRTTTHKLIHFYKSNEWEMYDLVADPDERINLASNPAHAAKLEELKQEITRLKKELDDKDEYAYSIPTSGVDAGVADRPFRK
jgi:arylsulfatase A-like enzyme